MNKTHFFKWIFLFLIGCCACNSFTKNRTGILPIDSAAVLIAECFLLEGEIHVYQWTSDVTDYSLARYDSLFRKYDITSEIFMQNVRYYLTNKKYAEKMMDKVSEIVDQRAAALKDSLNVEQ